MFKNNKIAIALSVVALLGATAPVNARPNIGSSPSGHKGGPQLKTTASTCKPAEAHIDLDINNVRARLMTGGDMWWDIGTEAAQYEIPKGSKKNSLFAGSVWIGGYDASGNLKVAAQTYRQDGNDYWPGPLDAAANISSTDCSEWDKQWKISRTVVNNFRDLKDKSAAKGDPDFDDVISWPAKGNDQAVGSHGNNLNIDPTKDYAPFVDVNNNGIYDPMVGGDYPDIKGDQFIWWVFNDKGNVKQQSKTEGIGLEVQASAFAYASKDYLNDATFYNYRVINRGNVTLDSTYISTWTDADLGYYKDDFIGCDTSRGLGILYNGRSVDGYGEPTSYGDQVPMVGVDFFKGPLKPYTDSTGKTAYKQLSMEAFTYYNNDFSVIGNPSNGIQIYGYMTGSITNGQRFSNDFAGAGIQSKGYGSGPVSRFVFTGDPSNTSEWSECTCGNAPDDRRFVHSSGPFKLLPGVVNDITIGAVWVADVGGCPNTSFKRIRQADDAAQALFDNNFQAIEGPEAPTLVVRELDRKLVFYITNDSSSTNFQEKYGRDTAAKYRVASSKAEKYVHSADSLYKFEGYRIFQLKDATVTPAQIFDQNGNIDGTKAVEIFQCDIKNGITKIVNYDKLPDISDTTYQPLVKVSGKDSGIIHSFEVSIDKFATGSDKRVVNYRNYYFTAIAYAYNDFSLRRNANGVVVGGGFDPKHADSTQDVAYIESAHGANGTAIPVVTAMPNPANGAMGDVINTDYGDGVSIQRIEGIGNGGMSLNFTDQTEQQILANAEVTQPFYKPGHGPVNIKVIDPVRIQPYNWEFYIIGKDVSSDSTKGMDSMSTWKLINTTTGDTIYSENNNNNSIAIPNEQILAKYGLSVNVQQVRRPYDDESAANGPLGNGLIESHIAFADPSMTWLSGVKDGEQKDYRNWIRSGHTFFAAADDTPCNWNDLPYDTLVQAYEGLLPDYSFTKGTWAPYGLGSDENKSGCGFGTVYPGHGPGTIANIHSVDVVFTSDKSKWTRCVVIEMQDVDSLAEGRAKKMAPRSHRSWTGDVDNSGNPVYASDPTDTGMSWFPGYAVDLETGQRLNMIFGEDSYLKLHNGGDMIWNPTSTDVYQPANGSAYQTLVIYGGKHMVYVLPSKYDQDQSFLNGYLANGIARTNAYKFMWTGVPLIAPGFSLLPLSKGLIPTETRVSFRVNRPYGRYATGSTQNGTYPFYKFSTADQAVTKLSDNPNADKQALLDRIHAVPNPYYGYTGYETSRLDTRVRIINLPQKATVSIYSLDGTLVNQITKDNPNVSYVDWNVRNFKELPIASGMYLIHVKADGIGETVIRWFGSMRPLDITTY